MPTACANGARPSRLFSLAGVLLILGTATAVHAQTSLDIHTGTAQAVLSPDHQPWALGLDMGAGVRVRLSDQWRLRVHVDWRRLWSDTTTNAVVKFPSPDDKAGHAWTQATYALAAERRLPLFESIAPFAGAGFGLMSWTVKSYPGYETVKVPSSGDGTLRDYAADELYVLGIAGIEPRLFSNVRLRVEAGVNFLTGIGTDFADPVHDDRSHAQLTLAVGISIPLTSAPVHVPPSGPVTPPRFTADTTKPAAPLAQAQPTRKAGGREEPEPAKPEKRPETVEAAADTASPNATATEPDTTTRASVAPAETTAVAAKVEATPPTKSAPPIQPAPDTTRAEPAEEIALSTGDPNKDSDGDGVNDAIDACPDTPRLPGLVVNPDGCPVDTDRDGIPDYLDACPGTPRGTPVNTMGCVADSDNDGITDDIDQCPDTPSGLEVDSAGCLVMTQLQRRLILHVIYVSGTTDPDPMSQRILDDLAVRLKNAPKTHVLIEGFTDNIGEALANLNVSQKRANKVKEYLISKGVSPERLNAIGRGETRFIADNSNAAGREKNRRIEISFRRSE